MELREQPKSIDSEKYVLGCILAYKTAIHKSIEYGLQLEYFYDSDNALIYEAIKRCKDIDLIQVAKELRDSNKIEKIGGYTALTNLMNNVGTDAHLETHINSIKADYIRREVIKASMQSEMEAYRNNNAGELLELVNNNVDNINEIHGGEAKANDLPTLLESSLQRADKRSKYYKEHGTIEGIKTNLKPLDNVIYGLQPNKLIILGGRPGSGKTAFALKLAKEVSVNNHVLFFSLEMGEDELSDRLILSNTDINPDSYAKGNLYPSDWQKLEESASKFHTQMIHIEDNPAMTIDKIKAKAMSYNYKNKCDFIIIDYLQLIDMRTHNKNYNKTNEVGELSRKCKLLAKELKVPILLLSQLNREVEKRPDKRPYLSDLRESGNIEQDADIVMFCYRPAYYDLKEDENQKAYPEGYFEAIVAKNRGGITGSVKLIHTVGLTNFSQYDEDKIINDYKETLNNNDPLDF